MIVLSTVHSGSLFFFLVSLIFLSSTLLQKQLLQHIDYMEIDALFYGVYFRMHVSLLLNWSFK